MRWVIVAIASAALLGMRLCGPAVAQVPKMRPLTLPNDPIDASPDTNLVYPDAIMCDVTSPDNVEHRIIFYKSQTISFGTEPNNTAEYGTTGVHNSERFDAAISYGWRLQLGRPGNITAFALPPHWSTDNCQVGKTIQNMAADKQLFRFLIPQ